MPNKLVVELKSDIEKLRAAFEKHLNEGVQIHVGLAKLQSEQTWLKVIGIIILTAIAGLYLKK